MFSPTRTSALKRRARSALGLTRSFLLLEDDYEVDWEVGQDERFQVDHPHRAALAAHAIDDRMEHRRPGEPQAPAHLCLSPVNRPARAHQRRAVRREGQRAAAAISDT
jgi:hypothetical protein